MDTRVDVPVARFSSLQKRVFALLLLIVVASAFAWWFRAPATGSSISPLPVRRGMLIDSVPINAIIVPVKESALSTVSGGTVASVLAVPGTSVQKGDPLVTLTNEGLEQQLAQAESDLALARLDQTNARIAASDDISARKVDMLNAQNTARLANLRYTAETTLQARGIISRLALEKFKAERDASHNTLEYAKLRVKTSLSSRDARSKAATQKVAILQARVNNLAEAVDMLTLRAPFDGVVAKIDAKVGAVIGPGVAIADEITSQKKISLEVAEEFADRLHVGQRIQLKNGLSGVIASLAPISYGGIIKGQGSLLGDASQLRINSAIPGSVILESHGVGNYVDVDGVNLANQSIIGYVRTADGVVADRELVFGKKHGRQVVVLHGAEQGDTIIGLHEDSLP